MRHPPTRAHSGESGCACSPTSCFSSESVPSSPGFFDSDDPRCTSQIVSRMKSVNSRYSDCQFSAMSTAKEEDVTYRSHEISCSPAVLAAWL